MLNFIFFCDIFILNKKKGEYDVNHIINTMLKTQKELMEYVVHATEKRMKKPFTKLALLSMLGGMFIAFGSVGNIITVANLIETNAGIAKFLGSICIPCRINYDSTSWLRIIHK